MDGQPRLVVVHHISCEKFGETLYQQLMYLGNVTFFMQERGKPCYITVWQRFAIDVFNYYLFGKRITLHKFTAHGFGKLTFQAVAYQTSAESRAAPLIAQNITQRRDLVNDLI